MTSAPRRLLPRRPVPDLELDLLDGKTWRLHEARPQHFTLLIFYRGLHCPFCAAYLGYLGKRYQEFQEAGVEVVVASCDNYERARRAQDLWELGDLPVGYGLEPELARDWGLYVSEGIPDLDEPALFFEPGLFLINPDGSLYANSVQSMPFARPQLYELLEGIRFIVDKDYPARGNRPLSTRLDRAS